VTRILGQWWPIVGRFSRWLLKTPARDLDEFVSSDAMAPCVQSDAA
jgi:hypothetical protein